MKTYILGSCATRDAFDHDFATGLELGDYTARTSLASLACKRRSDAALLARIPSTFQKRMVARDMAKSFWNSLAGYDPGVLLIDLIDDRFKLDRFADGSGQTASVEYSKAAQFVSQPPVRVLNNRSMEFHQLWRAGLERLCEVVHAHGNLRVFVNCVFFVATGDPRKDEAHGIAQMNSYLETAYTILEDRFGSSAMIRYEEDALMLDPGHKWGHAPFHYTQSSYACFMDMLKARIG